jgi:mannonate dehydratase
MKLAAVVNPPSEANLRTLAQIGVEHLVYYDMRGMPRDLASLRQAKERVERCGLRLSVIEGGPPIDRIVLGKPGRDQQIEAYKACLGHMGALGIRVLCYNFMPQVMEDAMVVRTSRNTIERGGALTSRFRLCDLDGEHRTPEGQTTDEQMWENLEYFLRRVVPAAEAAEVRLAMHPDDPPLSPIWGLARIMRDIASFEQLFALAPSAVNGITFCQGCFAEMGVDLPATIRRFAGRIHFAHFRDIAGTREDFRETFPDNGQTNIPEVLAAYRSINYAGLIRPDHVPQLATDAAPADGYGFNGHIFALGYMKGLMEPLWGKATAAGGLS